MAKKQKTEKKESKSSTSSLVLTAVLYLAAAYILASIAQFLACGAQSVTACMTGTYVGIALVFIAIVLLVVQFRKH